MLRIPSLLSRDFLLDGRDLFQTKVSVRAGPARGKATIDIRHRRYGGGSTYQISRLDLEDELLLLQILHKVKG